MAAVQQFQRSLLQVVTTVMIEASGDSEEISGFQEEGISFEKKAGKYEEGELSADGKVYEVSATNDNTGKVTINTFGFSPSRDFLYKIYNLPVGEDAVTITSIDVINRRRSEATGCTLIEPFKIKEGKKRGQLVFGFQSPNVVIDEAMP
jgi:hypothetical protein